MYVITLKLIHWNNYEYHYVGTTDRPRYTTTNIHKAQQFKTIKKAEKYIKNCLGRKPKYAYIFPYETAEEEMLLLKLKDVT